MADRAGFQRQLEPVLEVAYRVAFNLTRNKEDAMDLVQDASLQAYKGYDGFETGSNFKAWFLRIVMNRYLKVKARKRAETLSLDEATDVFLYKKAIDAGLHGNPDDPARIVLDGLDVDAVQDALDRLPEEFRQVAVMYFLNEFSYEEIASVLEIPIGTVRSRLHRGRKLLQKALWSVAEERGIVKGVANA